MPSMTLTEKILARASHRAGVEPGDNIWVDVDVLMTHDVCGPGTIGVFKQHFGKGARVWDADKVVIVPDHYIFTADAMANRNVDVLRDFVREQGLPHFYDVDGDGVYALNVEERMTLCNMVIEAGGKNGVIAPDEVMLDHVNARNRPGKKYQVVRSDPGAKFIHEQVYDVKKLRPVVARPHSPD